MNQQPLNPKYSLGNSTIPNYFKEYNLLSYTVSEVEDRFLQLYDEVNIPAKKPVVVLLKATSSFLNSSTLDSTFRPSREKNFTDVMIKKILDDIGLAFIEAIKTQEQFKQKNGVINESKVAYVLSDAIQYCMACVFKRLKELSNYNDRIYLMYQSQQNNLKKIILSPIEHPTFRPK